MNIFKSVVTGVVVLAVIIGLGVWAKEKPGTTSDPYATASVSVGVSPSVTASASAGSVSNQTNNMHEVTISTSMGDIVFQTYDGDAPKAVGNFITLSGKKFYDGVVFHRVINGFMIQGGDPKGDGTGGPGYTFDDELAANTESAKRGYVKGTVAMANAGPNTNGSQFFIMHEDYPLPHNYTIFGHVVRGQDIVDAIANVKTDENDRPLTPVVIKTVTVKDLK